MNYFRNKLKEQSDNYNPVINRDSRYFGLKDYARMYIRAIDRYNQYKCVNSAFRYDETLSMSQKNEIMKLCEENIKKIKELQKYKFNRFTNACLSSKDKTPNIRYEECIDHLFKLVDGQYVLIDNTNKKNMEIINRIKRLYVDEYKYFTENEWINILERFTQVYYEEKENSNSESSMPPLLNVDDLTPPSSINSSIKDSSEEKENSNSELSMHPLLNDDDDLIPPLSINFTIKDSSEEKENSNSESSMPPLLNDDDLILPSSIKDSSEEKENSNSNSSIHELLDVKSKKEEPLMISNKSKTQKANMIFRDKKNGKNRITKTQRKKEKKEQRRIQEEKKRRIQEEREEEEKREHILFLESQINNEKQKYNQQPKFTKEIKRIQEEFREQVKLNEEEEKNEKNNIEKINKEQKQIIKKMFSGHLYQYYFADKYDDLNNDIINIQKRIKELKHEERIFKLLTLNNEINTISLQQSFKLLKIIELEITMYKLRNLPVEIEKCEKNKQILLDENQKLEKKIKYYNEQNEKDRENKRYITRLENEITELNKQKQKIFDDMSEYSKVVGGKKPMRKRKTIKKR